MNPLKVMDWFVGLNLVVNAFFVAADVFWLLVYAVPELARVESGYFIAGFVVGDLFSTALFYGWAFLVAIAWWAYARPRLTEVVFD